MADGADRAAEPLEFRILNKGGISCQQETEQDRKAKEPEPDEVSARKPGIQWVAEQEPLGVAADGLEQVWVVVDAMQAAAADEEDKTRITNSEQMNDEG